MSLQLPAIASHPAQICLDLEYEDWYPVSNDDMVDDLRAFVGATDDDHGEPHEEGCVISQGEGGGTVVDFEIEGVSDPDASFSPESPDMTCTTYEDNNFCRAYPPSSGGGQQTIYGWIDFDNDDTSVELDVEEEPAEDDTDATDVVLWTWTHHDYIQYVSEISIRYREATKIFRGTVDSGEGCRADRSVKVRRALKGPDVLIGTDDTNAEGEWRITRNGPRGRFYAVVTASLGQTDQWTVRCRRAKSPIIRI